MILEIELNDIQLAKIADMVAAKLKGISIIKACYTVDEAAKLLGLTGRTIRYRVESGIIPKVPGYRAIRIPASYIDGLLNTGGNDR